MCGSLKAYVLEFFVYGPSYSRISLLVCGSLCLLTYWLVHGLLLLYSAISSLRNGSFYCISELGWRRFSNLNTNKSLFLQQSFTSVLRTINYFFRRACSHLYFGLSWSLEHLNGWDSTFTVHHFPWQLFTEFFFYSASEITFFKKLFYHLFSPFQVIKHIIQCLMLKRVEHNKNTWRGRGVAQNILNTSSRWRSPSGIWSRD